jgi:hypothetical protein
MGSAGQLLTGTVELRQMNLIRAVAKFGRRN